MVGWSGPKTSGKPAEGEASGQAAADRQVAPQARARLPEGQHVPGRQRQRRVRRDALAVDRQGGVRAGEGHGHTPRRQQPDAPEQDLQAGRVLGIADQPLGEGVRAPVPGARPGNAKPGLARASEVFDERPDARRLDQQRGRPLGVRHGTSTNRTRVPGASRAGGVRSRSHSTASVVPISRQPPGEGCG